VGVISRPRRLLRDAEPTAPFVLEAPPNGDSPKPFWPAGPC